MRNFFWRARLFWKRICKRSGLIEKLSCTWLWIQMPARRKLQRHRHKKKASKLIFQLSLQFVKPDRPTVFPLIRWSSSPGCYFERSSQKFKFPWQSTNEILFHDIKKVVIVRLGGIFETLSQRHSRSQQSSEHEKRVHSGKQWWQLRFFPIPPKSKDSPDLPAETFRK